MLAFSLQLQMDLLPTHTTSYHLRDISRPVHLHRDAIEAAERGSGVFHVDSDATQPSSAIWTVASSASS